MKYKVCSMLLAAALAFSLWPVSARADALETGGDFREATGEPASSDGELPDETGSQEESAGKDGDLDAENSDAAGTVGEEEITAVEEQVDFSEEIVVTGTAETEEADGADASGTGADGGNEEIMVFGLSDLDTDEEGNLRSADAGALDTMLQNTVSWLKGSQSSVLNDDFLSGVSSTATDWTAFSLGRLGISDNYSGFLAAADAYVRESYEEDPEYGLSYSKATEWHRLTLAVLAAGGDPTSVGGQDLIADGVYNCLIGDPWTQGVNGAFWGLLALDSRGYEVPEGAAYDRDDLIRYILDSQVPGGGWTLYGSQADVDMTAMAVYALAPYYAGNAEVRSAVDAGLAFLRNGISADGDLESDGDYNCESTAQTIVAFAAMGIDPSSVTSPESGKSLLDGLAQYYNTDTGGFRHTLEDAASNSMATDQALYAIAAYRYCQKGLSIWDFKSPSDTSSYRISAGSTVYTAEASADAVLKVGAGVKEIRIDNIPVGNYDAAEVRAGETVFSTAGRTADGSFPVEGTIPVADGTVLQITVYRQNGTEENWTLTVQTDTAAEARAVIRQIDSLPDAADLTLEDADAVKTARIAFEALGEEEKEQVTNIGRLEELEARLEELETAQEEEREKERRELQKKIEAIQTPVRISDRNQVNQYLQKLDELGDWPEKERLKALLDEYLAEIEKRQALVDELDADIWEQIDPLRIDQGDEAGVQALMARYSTLRVEEQEMLSNRQSLLEAAEVIQSLREGIIPARVFQNLRSTGETFIYEGVTSDGHAYTLTYEGDTVQAASDVAAGIHITTDTGAAAGAALQIEFDQQGSINGTAAVRIATDAAEGSYSLYWLNPDSLTIQSAGSGRIASGHAEISVRMGGRYWLSENVVRLDGNAADGSVEAVASGSGQTETAAGGNGSSESSGGSAGSGRYTASASGNRQTSGSQSTAASAGNSSGSSGQTVTDAATEGIMSQAELESIQGDRSRNLRTSGELTDTIAYTVTVNGEDVKNTDEFAVRIKADCSHAEDIHALAASPLVLCMEGMGTFPGTILVRLTTDLEDGNQLLFRFDPEERQAEYVKTVTVEDGEIAFTLDEGGDYFIARRALAGSLNDPDTEEEQQVIAAETEEFGTPTPWDETAETVVTGTGAAETGFAWGLPVGIAAACVAAGGAVLYIRRKRGKKQ